MSRYKQNPIQNRVVAGGAVKFSAARAQCVDESIDYESAMDVRVDVSGNGVARS
jgi:hypothetical protein